MAEGRNVPTWPFEKRKPIEEVPTERLQQWIDETQGWFEQISTTHRVSFEEIQSVLLIQTVRVRLSQIHLELIKRRVR